MSPLKHKKIILGVCGSVAAYKSAILLRELQRRNAEVRVVMTPSATKFVTPLTFSSLSRSPVIVEMFPDQPGTASIEHVELGLWADVMLLAPVTASTIAKLANGVADNLLTSIALALRAPLVIAPAMDADMYVHPTTSHNVSVLKKRGVVVIDPREGDLASGLVGVGRLAEIEEIVTRLEKFFEDHHRDFLGKKILVTAGPTQEPIDAVRFISNRSSGNMGYAIATAAAFRGAEVRLISGPVSLETPRNVTREDVSTADDMYEAVERSFDWCDILVMAAAVADFKVPSPPNRKTKKSEFVGIAAAIELVRNQDILQSVSSRKGKRILVGFALETEDALTNAREKLESKSLDLIVVNNPRDEGAGFGTETNKVTMISRSNGGIVELPVLPKYEVAMKILNIVSALI